jgi:hypothetical protein
VFVLARALLAACAEAPRFGAMVAVIATWCALLGGAWQMEAGVGGSVLSAALAVAPLAALAAGDSLRLTVFLLGLAFSQEPLAGLCAYLACGAFVLVDPEIRAGMLEAWRRDWRALAALKLAGLAPLGLAIARTRAAGVPVMEALMAPYAGERGTSAVGAPGHFVQGEIGALLLAAAVVGTGLALLVPRARATAAALVVMTAAGLACGWLGAPLGPTRFGAPVLAAVACACVLAGVAMQALVRAIAGARVPLARASAAMVLVLELAAPVEIADEAYSRSSVRPHGAPPWLDSPAATWDDTAWGVLPPRAVVLVTDRTVWRRAAAAAATGSLRGDVAVVPTFAHGAAASRVLARDAALIPLWRDLELAGAPGEGSLSSLAASRPVAMAFAPAWAHVLAKHLVPAGSSIASSPSRAARAIAARASTRSSRSASASPAPSPARTTSASPTPRSPTPPRCSCASASSTSRRPATATSSAAPSTTCTPSPPTTRPPPRSSRRWSSANRAPSCGEGSALAWDRPVFA